MDDHGGSRARLAEAVALTEHHLREAKERLGMTTDVRDTPLEEQYAICLDAARDAERLAAAGSVTAARELVGIRASLADLEARLAVEHRGPAPVTAAIEPPSTATLNAMHADCVALVESDDREARRDALARLLPYVARGEDLAFLLGFMA